MEVKGKHNKDWKHIPYREALPVLEAAQKRDEALAELDGRLAEIGKVVANSKALDFDELLAEVGKAVPWATMSELRQVLGQICSGRIPKTE